MELDSVDERALLNRPGVRGALAQGLPIGLPRPSDVLRSDRRERNELYAVDLDLAGADAVAAARPDPRSLPQADRERDIAGQNVFAQLAAELHDRNASRALHHETRYIRSQEFALRLLSAIRCLGTRERNGDRGVASIVGGGPPLRRWSASPSARYPAGESSR